MLMEKINMPFMKNRGKKEQTDSDAYRSVKQAVGEIKKGNIIIITDSEDRENEGDFAMAAENISPEKVNFMAKYGRGLICVSITPEKARDLNLEPMVKNNQDIRRTAFTVSVDAKKDITTGISAYDRSRTIKLLANEKATAGDFVRPGHIFPLECNKGGVLVRAGHTEASLDLARLANKKPVAVLCEIMKDDGSMARMPELKKIAHKFDMKIVTIKDLIQYLRSTKGYVYRAGESFLPTIYGKFNAIAFLNHLDDKVHLALTIGKIDPEETTLVRVHSECLTGDVFHSLRCDCGNQLQNALRQIAENGKGVLLYMRQEGRGIGIINKLKAYAYQDKGLDTVEANEKLGFAPDLRDYGIGAQILTSLGVKKMQLLTNNPRKVVGLEGYGLEIVGRTPLVTQVNEYNKKYLSTKAKKLGHFLNE